MNRFRRPFRVAGALLAAHALALATLAAQEPAERSFELSLSLSSTHLCALNHGDAPLVLLFSGADDARREQLVIPAGARIEARFAPAVLRGLEFVVAGRNGCGPVRSERYSLDALRARGAGELWFDLESCGVSAWVRRADWLHGVDALGHDNGRTSPPSNLTAPHVPVITPHDGQIRQAPPRLERKPLPPV